jgi:hypothetical protein
LTPVTASGSSAGRGGLPALAHGDGEAVRHRRGVRRVLGAASVAAGLLVPGVRHHEGLGVVILGAGGRDFNVLYRDDPAETVVAFTAAQIPAWFTREPQPVDADRVLSLEIARALTTLRSCSGGRPTIFARSYSSRSAIIWTSVTATTSLASTRRLVWTSAGGSRRHPGWIREVANSLAGPDAPPRRSRSNPLAAWELHLLQHVGRGNGVSGYPARTSSRPGCRRCTWGIASDAPPNRRCGPRSLAWAQRPLKESEPRRSEPSSDLALPDLADEKDRAGAVLRQRQDGVDVRVARLA